MKRKTNNTSIKEFQQLYVTWKSNETFDPGDFYNVREFEGGWWKKWDVFARQTDETVVSEK